MADPTLVVRVGANLDVLRANLADGTNQIETTASALTRMSQAFDGSKIIAQAGAVVQSIQNVGGVTSLTAAEQAKANAILDQAIAKYQALGMAVPPQMQALADATKQADDSVQGFSLSALAGIPIIGSFVAAMSVESVIAFSESTLTATSRFADLSLATGVSVDGIQRLQYVGQEFGIDIDQMSRGVEQFSAKLANGDANATKAVQMLGLSVSDLIASGPTEAFLSFADAAGRVEDPITKAGIAADGFGGKLAKTLLPSLQDLRTAMAKVPQEAIISDANVQAAHDFDVGLAHLGDTVKALTVDIASLAHSTVGSIIPAWAGGTGGQVTPPAPAPQPIIAPVSSHSGGASTDTTKLTNAQLWANMLDALKVKQAALTAVNADELTSDAALGVSVKLLADHYGLSEAAVTTLIDAHKKFEAAVNDVNSAGLGWKGTLDTISGDTVSAIQYYLQAGVAQGTLATYYGLTAAQIKSVASELANETAQHKLEQDAILETTKLWDEYNATAQKNGGTVMDGQIAAVDKWAEDLEAKMQKAGTDTAGFYDALTAVWTQKLNALGVNTKALQDAATTDSQASLQQIADGAYKTYQIALQHVGEWSDGTIKKFEDTYEAAQKAADNWGSDNAAWIDSLVAKQNTLTAAVTATATANDVLAGTFKIPSNTGTADTIQSRLDALNASLAGGTFINPTNSLFAGLPARAGGGPVVAGQAYTVGERGPETLVMGSAGGTIVPNGAWGSGGTTFVIQVTQPLGTPAAIAHAVDQALMARQRNSGQRILS